MLGTPGMPPLPLTDTIIAQWVYKSGRLLSAQMWGLSLWVVLLCKNQWLSKCSAHHSHSGLQFHCKEFAWHILPSLQGKAHRFELDYTFRPFSVSLLPWKFPTWRKCFIALLLLLLLKIKQKLNRISISFFSVQSLVILLARELPDTLTHAVRANIPV